MRHEKARMRETLLAENFSFVCERNTLLPEMWVGWSRKGHSIKGELISLFSSVLLSDCLSENNGLVRKHAKFSSDFSSLFLFFLFFFFPTSLWIFPPAQTSECFHIVGESVGSSKRRPPLLRGGSSWQAFDGEVL